MKKMSPCCWCVEPGGVQKQYTGGIVQQYSSMCCRFFTAFLPLQKNISMSGKANRERPDNVQVYLTEGAIYHASYYDRNLHPQTLEARPLDRAHSGRAGGPFPALRCRHQDRP